MKQPKSFDVPLLLIIYNRPQFTDRLLAIIAAIRPSVLFIAADAPSDDPTDQIKCMQAREIVKKINWDCHLETKFSDVHMGVRNGPYNAIMWFFSKVDRGIILEDDIMPSDDFFWFCLEMLEKYEDDKRIMLISGCNFQAAEKRREDVYFFSKTCTTWGWASWKRAIQNYDINLESFPYFKKQQKYKNVSDNWWVQKYWMHKFEDIYEKRQLNSWDWPFYYHIWFQNGLSIIPGVNLVSNIGIGNEATHTKSAGRYFLARTHPMKWPLKHPTAVLPDIHSDASFYRKYIRWADMAAIILYRPLKYVRLYDNLRNFYLRYILKINKL
jgi:hypothetical protein